MSIFLEMLRPLPRPANHFRMDIVSFFYHMVMVSNVSLIQMNIKLYSHCSSNSISLPYLTGVHLISGTSSLSQAPEYYNTSLIFSCSSEGVKVSLSQMATLAEGSIWQKLTNGRLQSKADVQIFSEKGWSFGVRRIKFTRDIFVLLAIPVGERRK